MRFNHPRNAGRPRSVHLDKLEPYGHPKGDRPHQQELLDEALEESFPASDPIASQNID